jgi:hypothetical protein
LLGDTFVSTAKRPNPLIPQAVRVFQAMLLSRRQRKTFSRIAICNKCEQRRAGFLDKLVS